MKDLKEVEFNEIPETVQYIGSKTFINVLSPVQQVSIDEEHIKVRCLQLELNYLLTDGVDQIVADLQRQIRGSLIEEVQWRIDRYRDEVELGIETTEELHPLLLYVQKLRDVPQQEMFPFKVDWPSLGV